ncbi:MAG: thiamine phosphate synthase [Vicinamibacterales bacterium]
MQLEPPAVCVVTRARGAEGSKERLALLRRLAAAAEAGAAMIQVRERQLDDRALVTFIREVLGVSGGTACKVLVNERLDIAIAAGAQGVHLKSDSLSAPDARGVAPVGAWIGRSVHSVAEAMEVESAGGCDYLFFGTVFPSTSKADDHPVAGLDALRDVCEKVALPVVAIGGVTPARAAALARAGAAGAAAISLFAEADDVGRAVSALRDALTVNQRNV